MPILATKLFLMPYFPTDVFYEKPQPGDMLNDGRDIISTNQHSAGLPNKLADELFYFDCNSKWVMYANYKYIFSRWQESSFRSPNFPDMFTHIAFKKCASGRINNLNFPNSSFN